MVPYLEDIALQVLAGGYEAAFGFVVGITHKQERHVVVGDFEHNGVLIEISLEESLRRRENVYGDFWIEIDLLASLCCRVGDILLINQGKVRIKDLGRMRLTAI